MRPSDAVEDQQGDPGREEEQCPDQDRGDHLQPPAGGPAQQSVALAGTGRDTPRVAALQSERQAGRQPRHHRTVAVLQQELRARGQCSSGQYSAPG